MPDGISRRSILSAGIGVLASPLFAAEAKEGRVVTFGIIADIHDSSPDFVIQLGDHCHAYPPVLNDEQRAFVKLWLSTKLPKYNVLGNHELDKNTKGHVMATLEMPKSFYSFDIKGVHCVVLDCMYILRDGKYVDFENGNYWSPGRQHPY